MNAYAQLIEKLTERAPATIEFNGQKLPNDKRAFPCQITTKQGAVLAGALTKTSIEGLYSLRTLVRQGDSRTGEIKIVDQFVVAEDIAGVLVPVENEARSGLIGPSGKEVVSPSGDL